MINIDEYLRFRLLENKFKGLEPRKREYAGTHIRVSGDSGVSEKYAYLFHPMFGTVVVLNDRCIQKTPLCEQIDAEILDEWRALKGAAPFVYYDETKKWTKEQWEKVRARLSGAGQQL